MELRRSEEAIYEVVTVPVEARTRFGRKFDLNYVLHLFQFDLLKTSRISETFLIIVNLSYVNLFHLLIFNCFFT